MLKNTVCYSPVLSSIFVFESMDVLDFPGIGGLSGTIVGTAIDPAVILLYSYVYNEHK